MTASGALARAAVTVAGVVAAGVASGIAVAEPARGVLSLDLSDSPVSGSLPVALDIAQHNLRGLLLPVGAAVLVLRAPRIRPAGDGLIAVVLGGQVALWGVALGAYGARLLAMLPHLPVELGAVTCATAAWVAARRDPHAGATVGQLATATAGLVLLGAALETYLGAGAQP